jgi:hypothetical protein
LTVLIQDVKCNICKEIIATVREGQAEPEWMALNAVFLQLMTWPVMHQTKSGNMQGHPAEDIALCEKHGKSLKAAIKQWWKSQMPQDTTEESPINPD